MKKKLIRAIEDQLVKWTDDDTITIALLVIGVVLTLVLVAVHSQYDASMWRR